MWFQAILLTSGMVVGLVQKPSDAVGVLTQPVLITVVWYGSGGSLRRESYQHTSTYCVCCLWRVMRLFFVEKHVTNMIRFFVIWHIKYITKGQSWMQPDLSVQRKTTNGLI